MKMKLSKNSHERPSATGGAEKNIRANFTHRFNDHANDEKKGSDSNGRA